MIVRFWYQIDKKIPKKFFFFDCYKFNVPMSSYIIIPKTVLFMNLKKSISKSLFAFFLRSVFITIYGFNQAFKLNLMILCTFFNTYPWFNACFRFLICITYSVLSCKLARSFSNFLIFIVSGKKCKSL